MSSEWSVDCCRWIGKPFRGRVNEICERSPLRVRKFRPNLALADARYSGMVECQNQERCMRLNSTIAVLMIVLCSTAIAQQQPADGDKNTLNVMQSMVKTHDGWGKLNSPGVSVQAKEVQRQGSWVQYHLFVSGLPSDTVYSVVSW